MQLDNVRYINVILPIEAVYIPQSYHHDFVYMQVWEVSISKVFPRKECPSYKEAALLHVSAHFRWHCSIVSLRASNYIYLDETLITIYLTKMLNNLNRYVVYAGHVHN